MHQSDTTLQPLTGEGNCVSLQCHLLGLRYIWQQVNCQLLMSLWIWGTDMIQLEVTIWLGHSLSTWWVLLGYIIKNTMTERGQAVDHTTELVMSTPVHCQRGGIGRRWPGPMSNVIRKSKRIYCVKRQPEWSKALHSCGCYFNLYLNIVADHLHNLYLLIVAGSLKKLQILYERTLV